MSCSRFPVTTTLDDESEIRERAKVSGAVNAMCYLFLGEAAGA